MPVQAFGAYLPFGCIGRKHPWFFLSFLMASFPASVAQMLVKSSPWLEDATHVTSCICTRELFQPSTSLSRLLRFIRFAEISRTGELIASKLSQLVMYHWQQLLSLESCGFTGPFFSRSRCDIMWNVKHEMCILKGLLSQVRTRRSLEKSKRCIQTLLFFCSVGF